MPIAASPVIAATLLSILPPAVFVYIRRSVKITRREVVRDLEAVFSLPVKYNATSDFNINKKHEIIPSFEFVKYKYFFKRTGNTNEVEPKDHSIYSWFLASIPLVIFLFAISYVVSSVFLSVVAGELGIPTDLACPPGQNCPATHRPLWIWCLCAAFAGGYVFMIRSFFRAVNNFDFSPRSFVGACNNLFVGVVGAMILPYAALSMASGVGNEVVSQGSILIAAVLSFAIGYLPDVATRTLLSMSKLSNFKRENPDIYKQCLTTPVEIIDGIDSEISDRLADHHIRSAQNLATANPLMLFVETPYGVYQMMDWVAQAQLCCSVGPDALTKFWALGIRTLFDLERAARDEDCKNDGLLLKIADILFDQAQPAGAVDTKTIIANICLRLDDPHVQRLRQIYIQIGDRLGDDTRGFPPRKRGNGGGGSGGSGGGSGSSSGAGQAMPPGDQI